MDLGTITVDDFKCLFKRDFPCLPVWSASKVYNTGAKVYYEITDLFYSCKANGTTALPTDATKWDVVTDDVNNYISDDDIERAFSEAKMLFNQSLFGEDDQIKMAFLYLAAHYVVNDARTAASADGRAYFNMTSRTVGNVSESFSIPVSYADNPMFNFLSQSGYGVKYLQFLLPAMVGGVGVVCGGTTP